MNKKVMDLYVIYTCLVIHQEEYSTLLRQVERKSLGSFYTG